MTLVVALRAGPGIGVACADRQITYDEPAERTFENKGRKIIQIGDRPFFVGIATGSDIGYAEKIVYDVIHRTEGKNLTYRELVDELMQTYNRIRDAVVHNDIAITLGIDWDAYVSGQLSQYMTDKVMSLLSAEHKKQQIFDVDLLMCGLEDGGIGKRRDFGITTYRSPGTRFYNKYSDSLGSGSDMADILTSEFLESVPARREKLGISTCAKVLMEAKRKAAQRNPGVGRRSQLVWIDENGLFNETSERETALLSAVLDLKAAGIIQERTVTDVYTGITESPKDKRPTATDQAYADVVKQIPSEKLYRHVLFEREQ